MCLFPLVVGNRQVVKNLFTCPRTTKYPPGSRGHSFNFIKVASQAIIGHSRFFSFFKVLIVLTEIYQLRHIMKKGRDKGKHPLNP